MNKSTSSSVVKSPICGIEVRASSWNCKNLKGTFSPHSYLVHLWRQFSESCEKKHIIKKKGIHIDFSIFWKLKQSLQIGYESLRESHWTENHSAKNSCKKIPLIRIFAKNAMSSWQAAGGFSKTYCMQKRAMAYPAKLMVPHAAVVF